MKGMNMPKRIALGIAAALFFAAFCLSLIFPFFSKLNAGALNTADLAKAYQAGGGAELWDTTAGVLNETVLEDLSAKLFGDEDPVEYVKTMKDTQTDSYVIPASTINAKVNPTNPDYGMVIKLGGFDWMATSLTLDSEENVVLTLYLSGYKDTIYYATQDGSGSAIYCHSNIRNHLLTHSTWALFQDSGEDSFARQFLVQPQFIKYQLTEQISSRQSGFSNCPNDALTEVTYSSYMNPKPKPETEYSGIRYDAWGEDYIWIPSITETGSGNIANTTCIWKLSDAQRIVYVNSGVFLRSSFYNGTNNVYSFSNNSASAGNGLTKYLRGVRPAIHLNLTAAGLVVNQLKNSETVTTTYNGEVQSVESVYTADPTAAAWYKPKYYVHDPVYVTLEPENGSALKDAGTYWVKAEIQQAWIDAVNAEVDAQKTDKGWTDEEVIAEKERRRPQFKGEPDTSDPEHQETDLIRWFQFVIQPKQITLNKPSYNADTGQLTPATFADPSEFCDDFRPTIATKLSGNAGDGTPIEHQLNTIPNKRGTYTAQAVFVNSDQTEYAGNYVIKDAATCTCTVTVNRGRIEIVDVAKKSEQYSGEKVQFQLINYTAAWDEIANLTLPEGMELEGNDTDGWFLTATTIGEYSVTATIPTEFKSDWCWNTSNIKEEDNSDRTFTITITRKTLTVEFTSTGSGFLLEKGADVKFGVKPTNAHTGDTVALTLAYYNTKTPETVIPVTTGTLDASALNPGTYTLVATLSDDAAEGNKNYVLENGKATQDFTVSAKNIEINSVTWQYSQNNGAPVSVASSAGLSETSPFEVTYNQVAYVFTLVTSGLADLGVKVDPTYETNGYLNNSQLNYTANAVAVSVRLVPFDEGFAFNNPETGIPLEQQYKDFTLYVKVNKADVDFSQVKWSAEELEFNAVNQQVTIESGFPSFLTPIYNHPSATNVDEYDTSVSGVTVNNSEVAANYNIPSSEQLTENSFLKHHWKIVKKKIVVTWTSEKQEKGGKSIFVPVVSDNSLGAIVYSYYQNDKSTATTLDDIFAEYSEVEIHTYWACAKLKAAGSSGSAYNETNCVLIEGGKDVTATGSFQSFTTGENKTAVTVGIIKSSVIYNKLEQPVEIEFQGGSLTVNDFTVTYTKVGDAAFSGIPQNAGSYKAVISLNSDKAEQYAITGDHEFDYVIEKVTFDLSGWKWVDSQNGNAEYTEAYVYNGKLHKLEYSGEALEGLTVKYTPETQANTMSANAGEYHVIVTFETPDTENYVVPDNVEFTWKINKADIDLSKIKWSNDELEYNTVNQQVTIASGFPSFLTPQYLHPSAKDVGEYDTSVIKVTVNDTAVAANYNDLTEEQVAASSYLKHHWKIVKKKILVTWTTVEQHEGDTVVFLPTVSDNSLGAIVYSYWDETKTTEKTLHEIFSECSEVETKNYYVCAKLKPVGSSGSAYNESNCLLFEGVDDKTATGAFYMFTTGQNKTPILVGINKPTVVYNKAEQPVDYYFQGGDLTLEDFTITYTKEGDTSFTGTPKYAGKYKVSIALDKKVSDTYAITGKCEFDYVIEKFTYDLSGMKWVDTKNGNAEYTEPYVYNGKSHVLSYTGDEIEGLTVGYTIETEANLLGKDAGEYHVIVTFEVNDADNYNVPENIDFTWKILPYTPDLSAVNWNYNTEGPFTFKIVDGAPVKYKVSLVNVPEGLEKLITYSGDTGEYSDAGSHVTTFAINEESPERKNYGELVFASGLENRLVWEIKSKLIDKAENEQSQVFRAEGYSFAEITKLPEDYAQYFEIQVVNALDEDVPQTDGTWNFVDVDMYYISIRFKSGMNKSHGGTADNVKWSDNAKGDYQIIFEITQLVLNVEGWIDGTDIEKPELNSTQVTEIEMFFDYVVVNTETGETVPANATLDYETVYSIALKIKTEYSGNVVVTYLGAQVEETLPYAFLTGPDPFAKPPTDFYRKPTADELYTEYRYTGKEITFKLGSWFVEEKMRILGGVMSGVEEGEYQVRVGFKRGSRAAWESPAKAADTSAVTATFVISKDAKIVDRFMLTDAAAANHPFKFQYGDFTEVVNIEDYAYDAAKPLYITRLTINDSLQVLIAQFENTDMIKAFDKDGVAITNLTRTLASGMALKIMDGDTVVNVLTLSVLGDINGDGEVGSPDKAKLNAFTLRKAELDGAYLLAGDIDFDKEIGSSDKAKLNAFTLSKADIYKGLTLTSASPAVQSVAPAVTKPVAVQSAPVTLLAVPVEADEVKVEETEAVTQPETVSEEMEIAQVSVEQEVQNSEQSQSEYALNTVQTMFAPVQEKRYALAASRRETL